MRAVRAAGFIIAGRRLLGPPGGIPPGAEVGVCVPGKPNADEAAAVGRPAAAIAAIAAAIAL